MKNAIFEGACTALVTPFFKGSVNFPLLQRLLVRQIDAGIPAVVVCGTTGESATLSDGEKLEMFRKCKQWSEGRCRILAGTGSNNTEHAVMLSKAAEASGADGLLVVTPYYNKATPDGLLTHYCAIASAVHIPIILYNVPSRTGVDIPVSIYQQLAKIPNIVGVKEASTDLSKIAQIRSECPSDFALWGGNDDQAVAVMALGGSGIISVLSNILPVETSAMAAAALDGDFDTAAELQLQLLPLIRALFREVNPIPVKAAMEMMGYDCGYCRLPLTPPAQETLLELKKLLPQ